MTEQTATAPNQLGSLSFDNRFTRELPGDPEETNECRTVEGACYSFVTPKLPKSPRLAAVSPEVFELLGIDFDPSLEQFYAEVLSGYRLLDGMEPYAMCYGGHQFGNWAGQLGDGRAINLGEVVAADGAHWTLQLKGAGPTPYSRMGDGFAVLRSSVREFLCSEAMFHLGVPTTRALSLVTTGEQIVRDMFYDGNAKREPGAIVCRVARSFVRLGSFQIFAARRDTDNLKRLADYTIRHDFPHLPEAQQPTRETYIAWFNEVCRTTAELMAHWMRVGFVHGVMNTDNLSILGETIDYGPYGWLEDYDPDWTPNTTDAGGRRYRFSNQPQIALWNLMQWANAIYPLIEETDPLQHGLDQYSQHYAAAWHRMLADKLGWAEFDGHRDAELSETLFERLSMVETDMTIFFRRLAEVSLEQEATSRIAAIEPAFYSPHELTADHRQLWEGWLANYAARCRQQGDTGEARKQRMNAVNPLYVLRNYLAQLAIDKAEQGDMSLVHKLLDVLRRPYQEQPNAGEFAEKRPEWARHRPGCSMLSCSS